MFNSRLNFYYKNLLVTFVLFFLIESCRNKATNENKMPEENRFSRVVLRENLYMPMELEVATDGNIYMIEANGRLSKINPKTKAIKLTGTIKNFDNGEHGLIGMALDPQFDRNHWIYLHYFLPDRSDQVAQISRFTIIDDSLDMTSEKKYIQIPYDNTCCHTAGSMSFDCKGNLYFSTGDNTDAFETTYSPHDERAGHELANDMRSAANSMDLRGKICRIHPEDDGSYTIPKDNLFADKKNGLPEIYIMGCRNPFRLFVDKETDKLLWGEVGPDAGVDSTRGPRGYDEFNIATKAGNYGWPLFIGNNIPYEHIDFATNKIFEKFNPDKPVNNSRLNTGIKELPLAHGATIYYPYGRSEKFPHFGEGGRTAIGGPVYYYNAGLNSPIKFPEYFDKGWFIADWMRNWIKVAHLDEENQVKKIDDLMPSGKFNKPIDMAFSPADGALYMLEFGVAWGPSPESRLVRLEYNAGNRNPVARLAVSPESGGEPLTVHLSGKESFDYDHDSLKYNWSIDGKKLSENNVDINYTFNTAGIHKVNLSVTDGSGSTGKQEKEIKVGNTIPDVSINLKNHTFYWDTLQYQVIVRDNEDGEPGKGISSDSIKVTLSYKPKSGSIQNNNGELTFRGEVLLNESDCKGCHAMKDTSAGPDFFSIAHRYYKKADDKKIIDSLADKIITGGSGVWGKNQMSSHPQLSRDQTIQMIKYILSLADEKPPIKNIPVSGNLNTKNNLRPGKEGFYVLEATYTDKGGKAIKPLSATARETLRYYKLYAEDFEKLSDMRIENNMLAGLNTSYASIKDIDFSGIKQALLRTSGLGGAFEIRIDSSNGEIIATFPLNPNIKDAQEIAGNLKSVQGKHDLYLRYINNESRFHEVKVEWLLFK